MQSEGSYSGTCPVLQKKENNLPQKLIFRFKTRIMIVVKKILLFLCLVLAFQLSCSSVGAIYDPLSRPNNFYGIHILFPAELEGASNLVNSTNGEWGYVTIPIQAGDKDLEKWQDFMDHCRKLKLIPILRLSTEADPHNKEVWRIPQETDILDFANFLSSLKWPIENRYIVFFNEINRFDEWGGVTPDPVVYTDLLNYGIDTFKEKNGNFFIIMGGLDNAAPNDGVKYIDNFVYIREMQKANPEIFKKLDGFASHSYPNPDFSQPPLLNKREGVTTYKFEYDLINSYAEKKVPAFILETGWHSDKLGEGKVANYYKIAYDEIWGKDRDKIVAVTPFLLNSQGGGSFDTFSFIKNGRETEYYKEASGSEKTKGMPLMERIENIASIPQVVLHTKKFIKTQSLNEVGNEFIINYIKFFF